MKIPLKRNYEIRMLFMFVNLSSNHDFVQLKAYLLIPVVGSERVNQNNKVCIVVMILNRSIIWIWLFRNIIVDCLLNLRQVSYLLRLKSHDTGVFHCPSVYVECVSYNLWKTNTISFVFAKDIMNSGLHCTTTFQPPITNFKIFQSWLNLSTSLTTYKDTLLLFFLKP